MTTTTNTYQRGSHELVPFVLRDGETTLPAVGVQVAVVAALPAVDDEWEDAIALDGGGTAFWLDEVLPGPRTVLARYTSGEEHIIERLGTVVIE